jgi:putative flippase GtrA
LSWEQNARRIRAGTKDPANWFQLVRFAVVGASGYAVNLVVFALLVRLFGLHHAIAAVGAFCVAVTNNFYWNRRWTFAGAAQLRFQGARFFTVSLVALGVNLCVLEFLVGVLELPPVLGQAIAVAVATPVNFIGNKLWTFGASR